MPSLCLLPFLLCRLPFSFLVELVRERVGGLFLNKYIEYHRRLLLLNPFEQLLCENNQLTLLLFLVHLHLVFLHHNDDIIHLLLEERPNSQQEPVQTNFHPETHIQQLVLWLIRDVTIHCPEKLYLETIASKMVHFGQLSQEIIGVFDELFGGHIKAELPGGDILLVEHTCNITSLGLIRNIGKLSGEANKAEGFVSRCLLRVLQNRRIGHACNCVSQRNSLINGHPAVLELFQHWPTLY